MILVFVSCILVMSSLIEDLKGPKLFFFSTPKINVSLSTLKMYTKLKKKVFIFSKIYLRFICKYMYFYELPQGPFAGVDQQLV